MTNFWLKFFATGAFISYIPTAILRNKKNSGAGLLGTFEAFVLFLFFMPGDKLYQAMTTLGVILLAVYVSDKVKFKDDKKDNPKIVIDEIAGYFTAMFFLPHDFLIMFLAFVLFRVFDTTKLAFIKKAENFGQNLPEKRKNKFYVNGAAVVLDDVLAGVISNLIIWCLIYLKLI